MLTDQEIALIRETFARGPAPLIEAGYDEAAMQAFFSRSDVVEYFQALDAELEHADALEIRTRFMVKRNLSKMSGAAVAVLGRSMAGPRYLRVPSEHKDQHGEPIMAIATNATGRPILREPEITPVQLRAAEATLDYLGTAPGRVRPAMDADLNIKILFDQGKPKIAIDDDPAHEREEEKAFSRERVRNVISILADEVPGLRDKLDESLGLMKRADAKVIDAPKKTVRKRKASKKKKATKKKTSGRKKR